MLFRIADRLGQPVFVVERMSYRELSGWVAYFRLLERENG